MMLRRLQLFIILSLYNTALKLAYIFNNNNINIHHHQKQQIHSKIISSTTTALYAYSEQDHKSKQPIDDSAAKASNEYLESLLQDTFPRISYSYLYEREAPDFSKLAPNDPFFLDMPWPQERGPESAAFAKHIQWKRRLSDGERMRWQKWAIYQRIMKKDMFKYRADDYIIQSLIKDLNVKADYFKNRHSLSSSSSSSSSSNSNTPNLESSNAVSTHNNNNDNQQYNTSIESALFKATAHGLQINDEEDIKAVMKSFYTIINHKNYDEIRTLWLPDSGVELILPGYDRCKGHFEVEKMYRKLIYDSKPFGKINHDMIHMYSYGYITIVYSIETIEKGNALRVAKKKKSSVIQSPSFSSSSSSSSVLKEPLTRLLAVTVLRKFNQQWRISQHHTTPYDSSTEVNRFPGEKVEIADTFQRRLYSSSSSSSSNLNSGLGNNANPVNSLSSLSSSPSLDIASLINTNINTNKNNNNNEKAKQISLSSSKLVDSVKTTDDVTADLWNKLKGFLDNEKLKSTATTQIKPDGSVENVINFTSNSQLSPPLPLQSESSQSVYKTSANMNIPITPTPTPNSSSFSSLSSSLDSGINAIATSISQDLIELQRLKEVGSKLNQLENEVDQLHDMIQPFSTFTKNTKNTSSSSSSSSNNNSNGNKEESKSSNTGTGNTNANTSSSSSSSSFIPKGSIDGYEFKRNKNNQLYLSRPTSSPTNNDDDNDDDEEMANAKETASASMVADNLWKSTSITKKTIQALRYLEKTKQLSKEDKNLLLMNMIDCISTAASSSSSSFSSSSSSSSSSLFSSYTTNNNDNDGPVAVVTPSSLVETSFDLLVMQNYKGSRSELFAWQPSSADGGMDDFLEQCEVLCQNLHHHHHHHDHHGIESNKVRNNQQTKSNSSSSSNNNSSGGSGSNSGTILDKKKSKNKSSNGIISINTNNNIKQQQQQQQSSSSLQQQQQQQRQQEFKSSSNNNHEEEDDDDDDDDDDDTNSQLR